MSVPRYPRPPRETDLDATDELPVLQLSEETLSETLGETDTFAGAAPTPVRDERIAQLEKALAAARQDLQSLRDQMRSEREAAQEHTAEVDRELAGADHELEALREHFEQRESAALAAQVEIDAQRRLLEHVRMDLDQRAAAFRHQAMDLAELRSRCERMEEALQSAEARRALQESQMAGLEAELRRARLLRPGNATLPAAPPQPESRPEPQPAPASWPAAEATQAESARAAIAVFDEQQFQINQLQDELAQVRQRAERLGEQLRDTEERSARLESLMDAGPSLEDSQLVSTQDFVGRHDPAPDIDNTGSRPGLSLITAELPRRMLVRNEGGDSVTWPLGRRTTIGRTPDNDIQLDVNYISRHHAVLLASAHECIVEDLNSTNGVLVNGKRVGRQALRDGDTIAVGATVFTYLQPE